jgi:hypothetical protein
LLRKLGLDIGHEVVEKDGTVSGYHASCLDEHPYTNIIHLTRHPLNVIASSQTLAHTTRAHMRKSIFIPEDDTVYPYVQAAYSVVNWNELIEKHATWRFQVETLEYIFPEFCSRVGVECPVEIPKVSKTLNTRRYPDVTLRKIHDADPAISGRVVSMINRYGYALNEHLEVA